jgi:primosomal protein N'
VRYARVAIDSPVGTLDRPFDYSIPERMLGRVQVGSVVRVVLHGRNVRAFVTELLDEPAVPKTRALSSLVSEEPIFTADSIELARFVARRYVAPLGLVLHDAVPGRFSTPKAPAASQVPRVRRPAWFEGDLVKATHSAQHLCVVVPTVLNEVELIAHAVGEAASLGRRSLVVCPRVDIAERIAAAVPHVALLHGEERPADRAVGWAAARDGRVDVVVGGRSALLAPIPDLGLVVVGSAHDRSLKSERAPRLHALVVARERARLAGAAFVACSPAPPLELATPDVEWIVAKRGPVRPETARPRKGPITPRLLEVIRSTIELGRDVLVFSGRKGGTLRLRCLDCGWTPSCPSCGSGLALEKGGLACRVCGATAAAPEECASCRGRLSERGWGHERIARELEKAQPGAPVVPVAAGSDLARRKDPVILVGTMAAAHASEGVGAVCVADLDQLLGRPDFRAAEYALQTLHELAGVLLSGGRFLVQTREPEHHVVQAFTRGSYRYFMDRELPFREETGYPPFGAVVRVELAEGLLDALRGEMEGAGGRVIGSVVRRGRQLALVRAAYLEPLLGPLRRFALSHPRSRVDVDPVDVT